MVGPFFESCSVLNCHWSLRMIQLVLLFLALSGLQALPISRILPKTYHQLPDSVQDGGPGPLPDSFRQGIEPRQFMDLNTGLVQNYISEMDRSASLQALRFSRILTKTYHQLPDSVQDGGPGPLPDSFRQGIEPSRWFMDLNTGLVRNYISEIDRSGDYFSPPMGNGYGEMDRRHWLTDNVPVDVPVQTNGGGWVRVEEPATSHLPDGFRQGTEPSSRIPDGFKQGTEPSRHIPDGFGQGTEPSRLIPDGFRQGTEPSSRIPDGFRQGTEPSRRIPDGFRQGTEPSRRIPDGFRQGTEPSSRIPDGFKQGTEPSRRIRDGFKQGTEPSRRIRDGFRQGTEPSHRIPDGFKQGTEPSRRIPDGFRQGTEPSRRIPDGFRQGTEPSLRIPDGFRQGTEPSRRIPDGFRQGTEPSRLIPEGFRQGTEPSLRIPKGFRQGTEPTNPNGGEAAQPLKSLQAGFQQGSDPIKSIPDDFRQETEPSGSRKQSEIVSCKGEVIDGRCYEFNPTPMSFIEAQDICRALAQNAQLASVTSEDLHSRLVSLVTNGGEKKRVLTWLGGMVKNQQASWVDGSEWSYSDWMPGQPKIHTDKPVCVEMFRIDESWWTAADCELKRASICSYPTAS